MGGGEKDGDCFNESSVFCTSGLQLKKDTMVEFDGFSRCVYYPALICVGSPHNDAPSSGAVLTVVSDVAVASSTAHCRDQGHDDVDKVGDDLE